MATARQIESNRKNAEKSTGPKTEEGKARSRANAFKHGLAGDGPVVEAERGEAFERRRESWAATYKPSDEAGEWALDQAVAATFQIDRCTRAFEGLVASQTERACLAWDLDRRVDASTVAAKLAKDPSLVARQLESTRHGCALMMSIWDRLDAAHEANGEWSDREASRALDLLGVPADLRDGRTPLDAPDGVDPATHRRALIQEETERLDGFLVGALVPLDDLARGQAEAGCAVLFSKPAALILRYERDAWGRYRAAMRDVKSPSSAPEPAALPAPPPVAPKPPVDRPAPPAPRAEAPPRTTAAASREFEAILRTSAPVAVAPKPAPAPFPTANLPYSYVNISASRPATSRPAG